jgi:hypothetical protein
MPTHRQSGAMSRHRTLATGLIVTAVSAAAALVVPPASAASRPSAPKTASATLVAGSGDDYRITWKAAAANGSAIKRYVIKVKGQPKPRVRVKPGKRSHVWIGPVDGRSPLTFQVRAVSRVGAGPWVGAKAGPPATAASRPGAPLPVSAKRHDPRSANYRVTWGTAAANRASIKRYVIMVKGQPKPRVRVKPHRRSYDWTGPVVGGSPLTFRVRAVNRVGAGPWAEAEVSERPAEVKPPSSTDFGLPYSAGSYFKSRVENGAVDTARTTQFREFMRTAPDQTGITWPKLNVNDKWAMSYHVGKASDPIWRLKGGNTSNSRLRLLTTQGFHMADSVADSFPTGDQDRPGVMVDPIFGYTVQFADAVPDRKTRTITVSNAGILWHSSNGLDYRNPKSDDSRNFTSRGRIVDSMVIRRDVLDKAVANDTGLGHVLHLFFVETNTADGFRNPMVGRESGKHGWGAQGERIRLKPTVDLPARGLSGAALAVARTLQQNGAYLGDNSGSSTQIKASQAAAYTGTNMAPDMFRGKISWDDFEVLR